MNKVATFNNFDLCQRICGLNQNILGAVIIENGELAAMYSRPEIPVPVPSKERFSAIFYQTQLMADMHRSNEDYYGDLRFFAAYFKHGDVFCFPLDKYGFNNTKALLAFKIIPPYLQDDLVEVISRCLKQEFLVT
jgi:hypothetical protein